MAIFINQVGYAANQTKRASYIGDAKDYEVCCPDGTTIYTGRISEPVFDEASGDNVSVIDFSDFTESGKYYICAGYEYSHVFEISKSPFTQLKDTLLKGIYMQRCGCGLDEVHAGRYAHSACHTSPSVVLDEGGEETDRLVDCTGGWHDAGDYGKYTVAACTALGHLLYSYTLFPDCFVKSVAAANRDYKSLDIIEGCRYELNWLLKMQESDGGVHHKSASKSKCKKVMPQDDADTQYLFAVSTTATAAFCAACALASGVFCGLDERYAVKLRSAAELAWGWLERNPGMIEFKNPKDVESPEYADESCADEMLWASAEMFKLTGDEKYQSYVYMYYHDQRYTQFGWHDVSGFGALAYLLNPYSKNSDAVAVFMENRILYTADGICTLASNSGYDTAVSSGEYRWGSNMFVLNRAMVLIFASFIRRKQIYIDIALEQLNYILGKNPMGICYVTGVGTTPYAHPYHLPSIADGIDEAVSGLLCGGANFRKNDDMAKELLSENTPPAKCYVDNEECYSLNETAVYWNSIAVFVTSFFDDELSR